MTYKHLFENMVERAGRAALTDALQTEYIHKGVVNVTSRDKYSINFWIKYDGQMPHVYEVIGFVWDDGKVVIASYRLQGTAKWVEFKRA